MTLLSPPRRIALLLLLGLVHSTGVLGACPSGTVPMTIYGQQEDSQNCGRKVANCEMHSGDGCSVCNSGYTVSYNGRECVRCNVGNCLRCSDNNVCGACKNGYQLNSIDGTTCEAEIPSCASYGKGVCLACDTGYVVTNGGKACMACSIPNCKSCSAANQCSECSSTEMVFTVNKKCVGKVANCKTVGDSGECLTCNDGYTLVHGACIECNVAGCDRCEVSKNVCTTCSANRILDKVNNRCITCNVPQCRECRDNDVCKACEDGYGVVSGGKCEPCKIEGCLICTEDAFNCSIALDKATVATQEKGIPWWVWLIVAIGAAALLGIILFIILWCCLRKPVVPVTVYEEDNYESDKGTDDDQTRDLALDFNNRSFFARPPPILIMNDYVQPRIYTQDATEVHGDLESAAADSEVTSDESGGSSESSRTGDTGTHSETH
ncbi:hypothetical protein, conserved [Angomonas deanei]|uniref:EGF-like domain-containing protein n=1 Tax=Angomonas deanei TaxID=59799 RepID=A0A7G2C9B0_9TRYP|nr:hypothetical protein, conserved [Angomonas deanei]